MGLFSSSKSSSSAQNTATDNRNAAGGDAISVQEGATLNFVDPDLTRAAGNIARASLQQQGKTSRSANLRMAKVSNKTVRQNTKLARSVVARNAKVANKAVRSGNKLAGTIFEKAASSIGNSADLSQKTAQAAIDAVKNVTNRANSDETGRTLRGAVPWLVGAVAAVALAAAWGQKR
jgi:hypothetical protein